MQQVGAEKGRRHRAQNHPADQPMVDRALAQVHRRPERAHHDRRHQIARDRRRGRHSEQQDQHRRHQRTPTGARQPDKESDDGGSEDYVWIDVHSCLARMKQLGDAEA